jgi:hypothetical protein
MKSSRSPGLQTLRHLEGFFSQEDGRPMTRVRWLVAIPVVLATALFASALEAAAIRYSAGMFGKEAVKKARAQLDRIESATGIPIVIETIDEIPDIDKDASTATRRKAIESLAVRRDKAIKDEGIYLLISKRDHVMSTVLVRQRLARVLPIEKRDAIRDAFLEEFKKRDFDAGLTRAVETIEHSLEGASVGKGTHRAPGVVLAPAHDAADGGKLRGARSPMMTFLLIILGIFGVLLLLRLLGGLFGRSAGAGYGGQMGGMQRPGMGPGYYGGAPGGGGGFFSGMLGGLGGALAGNWLYDQFSGRHGNMTSSNAGYSPSDTTSAPDQGGDAIVGADDDPGGGASWDDPGAGADAGGGDWGGDGGGGGDWGGGGGDWGGGGGGGGDW